jgi:uncharacterized protein with FMN-binding domain
VKLKIALLLSISLVALSLLGGCSAMSKMDETKSLTITTPNYKKLLDGTYRGAYDGGLVIAEVAITIHAKDIQSVKLLRHDHGRGAEAEKIVDAIVEAQSLEVDVISGATVSSKAILRAAENALRENAPRTEN